MRKAIKQLLMKILPSTTVHYIKKVRYTHAIRRSRQDIEIDMKMLRHLITPGDTVVDIGASIGYYSKMMAELVGPNGSVLSIEPILYTFGILKYMVRKLHLKNVTIMNVAVSEHDGIVSMVVPMNELGEPNLYESRVIGSEIVDQPHVVSIEARSIDSLFPGERKLSFIKCDAEGHELKCVLGARGVIRKWKPAWMIEIWGAPGNKTEPGFKTVELMRGEGYQTFWFDGGRLRKLAQDSQSVNGNYFFLHRCHLDHLIVAGLVEN